MKKIIIIALFIPLFFCCHTPKEMTSDSTLTAEEKKEGWQSLFDGKTLKGWHQYGNKAPGSSWKVKDGVLYIDTAAKDGGDIVTNDEYENFDFQVDWKISKGGNSGIIFMIHENKAKFNWPWETGPEMQVLDNEGHSDGKIKKHHAGDLFDLIASTKESAKPWGEWNHAEIRILNAKLDLFLNGENVVTTTLWDNNWKKLVAGSKFANMQGFGTFTRGRIGLQDHGDEVYFRNIKIRKL